MAKRKMSMSQSTQPYMYGRAVKKTKTAKTRAKKQSLSITRLGNQTLPDRIECTLNYSGIVAAPGAAFSIQKYRLNSVYDPDLTNAGHQPMGFDQLAALYGRYVVLGCHVTATYSPNGAFSGLWGMTPSNSETSLTYPECVELPYSKHSNHHTTTIAGASGGYAYKFTGYYDCAKIAGVSRAIYVADDRYQSLISSNPSETITLHEWALCHDGSTQPGGYWETTLKYKVIFFDRVPLGTS